MAKLSSVNKNNKRKGMVKKYAAKWAKLRAIAADLKRPADERFQAQLAMAKLPRNCIRRASATAASSPAAHRNYRNLAFRVSCCANWPRRNDPRRHEIKLVRKREGEEYHVNERSPSAICSHASATVRQPACRKGENPASKLRSNGLEVLKRRRGYIRDYSVNKSARTTALPSSTSS